MQNHRPARARRKCGRMACKRAMHTNQRTGPAGSAGAPSTKISGSRSSAVHAALLAAVLTTLARLLARLLLPPPCCCCPGFCLPPPCCWPGRGLFCCCWFGLLLVRDCSLFAPRGLMLTPSKLHSSVNVGNIGKLRRETAQLRTMPNLEHSARMPARISPNCRCELTPACRRGRDRPAPGRPARAAPLRPRRRTRCGSRPTSPRRCGSRMRSPRKQGPGCRSTA